MPDNLYCDQTTPWQGVYFFTNIYCLEHKMCLTICIVTKPHLGKVCIFLPILFLFVNNLFPVDLLILDFVVVQAEIIRLQNVWIYYSKIQNCSCRRFIPNFPCGLIRLAITQVKTFLIAHQWPIICSGLLQKVCPTFFVPSKQRSWWQISANTNALIRQLQHMGKIVISGKVRSGKVVK